MEVSGIVSAVVVGMIIGVVARIVVPGKQRIPLWLTALVGIVAALLGTFVATLLGIGETPGVDWIEVLIQVGIAAVGVTVASAQLAPKRRRRRARR
ncbi:GlsB/YeaQ/YmgE family stress response membrane protein [Allokutzneria oryzae]|uniref:GlsB/YeaQ/YmgE family stress response membrane protein n=1 Tax=Allokutzneria oryzae TaxID=1378989 RepID=A0ABV6A5J7_9PSEU